MKRVVWFLPGIVLFVFVLSILGFESPGAEAQEPVEPPPLPESSEQDTAVPEELDAVPEEISGVPGVTGVWWATVQEQIRRDMYSLNAAQAGGEPSHRGYNLAHNFDMTFSGDGLQLAPGQIRPDPQDETRGSLAAAAETGPDWQWSLRLTGYGYADLVQPLPSIAEASASENRLEYRRAGLSEYYINDEQGLEQGFILNEATAWRCQRRSAAAGDGSRHRPAANANRRSGGGRRASS